jgi:hypothetical protein
MGNYLGGIGKHRLIIRTSGGNIFDYTFPLCPRHGFKPEFKADYKMLELISLDINNPDISREYILTGFWGSWLLDWSEFPLDTEPGMKAIEFINKSTGDPRNGDFEILFQPNTDNNLWFSVNNTFETIGPRASIASENAAGTIGIRLKLEVKKMLNEIPIGPPSAIMSFTHVNNESIKFII